MFPFDNLIILKLDFSVKSHLVVEGKRKSGLTCLNNICGKVTVRV